MTLPTRCRPVVVLCVLFAGCAARVPPPPPAAPAALAYPEFVFPEVPARLRSSDAAARMERGWQYLQSENETQAQEEFDAAVRGRADFFPALAGRGYVALARGQHDEALEAFDAALDREDQYAPALVGRGQALLALEREEEALAAFEAALDADPSLNGLRSRVEVLRFRQVQAAIERARAAAQDGNVDDARQAYERAIAASPESAFLHRELGAVERRAGNADRALERFSRAAALDPLDVESLTAMGELLEARGDYDAARVAFERAFDVDPTPELAARIEGMDERRREAGLPDEFRAIADAPRITRAQLAALVGVRFEDVLRDAPARQIVMTDARGHWAEPWIQTVASAGVLELFENHAFQPDTPIRRVDLAEVVRELARLAAPDRPELDLAPGRRPAIADVNVRHLNYPAVSFAVASGVMPLLQDGRFEVSRPVSGAEASEVLTRLRALVANGR